MNMQHYATYIIHFVGKEIFYFIIKIEVQNFHVFSRFFQYNNSENRFSNKFKIIFYKHVENGVSSYFSVIV